MLPIRMLLQQLGDGEPHDPGESTLDFEIRAYVNSIDKRLRVQHEINTEVARAHANPAMRSTNQNAASVPIA